MIVAKVLLITVAIITILLALPHPFDYGAAVRLNGETHGRAIGKEETQRQHQRRAAGVGVAYCARAVNSAIRTRACSFVQFWTV